MTFLSPVYTGDSPKSATLVASVDRALQICQITFRTLSVSLFLTKQHSKSDFCILVVYAHEHTSSVVGVKVF